MGTEHLPALRDDTQADTISISRVQTHPSRLEQGKGQRRLGERENQQNEGATPLPKPQGIALDTAN